MNEIISDRKVIAKYQRQLVADLKKVCKEKVVCNLGYQGHSGEMTVFFSEKYDFWFTSQRVGNRYWNAFGSGRPAEGGNNSITVEINFPYEGINRSIGGVFAHDNRGGVLLFHRGKIGGGRVGIGKKLFFDNFRDQPFMANDDGIENMFSLIGILGGRYFAKQVGNFVSEIHRIKNLSQGKTLDFSFSENFSFAEETAGSKTIERSGSIVIERTHGIVVNSLAKQLEEKGHRIAKDVNRDLFIHSRGRITEMFEIKRSSSSQALYSAIGQLLVYSIPVKNKVGLIVVLPEKLNRLVERRLQELGLKVLYYDWNDGEPIFKNLELYV